MTDKQQLQFDLENKVNILNELLEIRSHNFAINYYTNMDPNCVSPELQHIIEALDASTYDAVQLARKQMIDARRALTNYELLQQFNNESSQSQ